MAITISGDSPNLTSPNITGAVVSAMASSVITSGTAVTASGTSIDFTGIPSWVKRITVILSGASTNGTSNLLIQIGSGSVTNSGYATGSYQLVSAGTGASSTAGFILTGSNSAASVHSGNVLLNLISANTWVSSGSLWNTANAINLSSGKSPALGGALDRIRITTVNGTDTFDAGTINILFE